MDFDPFGDPFRLNGPGCGGDDIFTTKPHFSGARATRKNDNAGSDAWELADEPFAEEIPGEASPEKVVLRNLKWEAETVGFNEETPVSVEVKLPEVHKNKR